MGSKVTKVHDPAFLSQTTKPAPSPSPLWDEPESPAYVPLCRVTSVTFPPLDIHPPSMP